MDFDSIIDWVIRVFPEFLSKWSDSLIIFLVTLWTKSILFVGKCLSSLVAFAEQLWQKTLLLFSDIGTGFTEFTRELRAKFPEVFPDYILSIVYPLPVVMPRCAAVPTLRSSSASYQPPPGTHKGQP